MIASMAEDDLSEGSGYIPLGADSALGSQRERQWAWEGVSFCQETYRKKIRRSTVKLQWLVARGSRPV